MKIRGMFLIVVLLLFIVTAAWIGITVYDSVNNVETNPNSESLRRPIQRTFDTEGLNEVGSRIEKLDVKPEVFHQLEDDGIQGVE